MVFGFVLLYYTKLRVSVSFYSPVDVRKTNDYDKVTVSSASYK